MFPHGLVDRVVSKTHGPWLFLVLFFGKTRRPPPFPPLLTYPHPHPYPTSVKNFISIDSVIKSTPLWSSFYLLVLFPLYEYSHCVKPFATRPTLKIPLRLWRSLPPVQDLGTVPTHLQLLRNKVPTSTGGLADGRTFPRSDLIKGRVVQRKQTSRKEVWGRWQDLWRVGVLRLSVGSEGSWKGQGRAHLVLNPG